MNATREVTSLIDALAKTLDGPPITVVQPGDDVSSAQELSRRKLFHSACQAGTKLQELGIHAGDRVVVMLPTGVPLLTTVFGIWSIGAATVPLPHVAQLDRPDLLRIRLAALFDSAQPRAIVGNALTLGFLRHLDVLPAAVAVIDADEIATSSEVAAVPLNAPSLTDIAHVQFSSGSTGVPRGSALTHRQILENIRANGERTRVTRQDRFVTWLPMFHDMGFIGFLCSIVWDIPCFLMATELFVSNPASWLEALSRFQGTLSPTAAFAISMIARRVSPRRLEGLDLSHWRYGWVGAEPVFEQHLRAFEERLAPFGLSPTTLRPCYGLAEATIAVSLPVEGTKRVVEWIDSRAFREDGAARPATPGAPNSVPLVSVGEAIAGTEIVIVDSAGSIVPERTEGHVRVRGPCVAHTFCGGASPIVDGWLETGDLGFMVDGQLFVTGRQKDVVIRGGVKYHPQDIEAAAQTVAGVRSGRVAAFSSIDPAHGKEELIVVIEAATGDTSQVLEDSVIAAVVRDVGVAPNRVVIVPPGSVPKTTSGKIQRSLCRELFVRGQLALAV